MTATKHDKGKARYDLVPPGPIQELAELFGKGAEKYGDRNWEKGMDWGRVFAAMQRHAWSWWGGEELDPVDGQHHLTSVMWCAMVLLEFKRTHPEHDDRPPADPDEQLDTWSMSGNLYGFGVPFKLSECIPSIDVGTPMRGEETPVVGDEDSGKIWWKSCPSGLADNDYKELISKELLNFIRPAAIIEWMKDLHRSDRKCQGPEKEALKQQYNELSAYLREHHAFFSRTDNLPERIE